MFRYVLLTHVQVFPSAKVNAAYSCTLEKETKQVERNLTLSLLSVERDL